MDIFEKRLSNLGPLGIHAAAADGYFMFPKLEGEIGNKMVFRGKECLIWSLNNYLGLANHPEVRKADADASAKWGLAAPMGARMMSGQTIYHEQLERELAAFVYKDASYLLNFGYQGMVSIIDQMVDRNDVIVYDSEAHACIIDGMRLHIGKRFVYPHNDMEKFHKQMERATKWTKETGGGILVITEGVYGMSGNLGNLKDIVAYKNEFNFRLLVDDAHGFGTMGKDGRGSHVNMDVVVGVDLYFATFAKSMAGIGAFVAGNEDIIKYLRFSLRSQIYAKSLPMPMVIGSLKRLDLIRTLPEFRDKLWVIVNALQKGLRDAGFDIGTTQSPVTPVLFSGDIPQATQLTYDLRENYNIFCSIVSYPVVPKGVLMLRLIPTAVHTLEDVEYTISAFKEIRDKLAAGRYDSGVFAEVNK